VRGTLEEIIEAAEQRTVAGEYVILIEGWRRTVVDIEEALRELRELMRLGKGRKEAVRALAERYGLSKKDLYDRSLLDG
jgi:16S rRNA (cytidine1402-2'-O)-methyltransferase